MDTQYTIKELAEKSGIEVRTIRWYIAEGLVRGPEAMGRNAYYTEHHLKRLTTIRMLKEIYRLPLSEIRRVCLLAGDEDIEIAVAGAPWMMESSAHYLSVPPGHPVDAALETDETVASRPPESDRLRESVAWSYRERARSMREKVSADIFRASQDWMYRPPLPQHGNKSIDELVAALRTLLGERRVSRTARSESLTSIEITPDMSLQVKGRYSREELARFEALADHLRELLVGGVAMEEKEPD